MLVSNHSVIEIVVMVKILLGCSHKLLIMFVSITFAFWQFLQILNTKFPFNQKNYSYPAMNDVTLNSLLCNCWMLHFIAEHWMVYLFMLYFMTVTDVSLWRNDSFLS